MVVLCSFNYVVASDHNPSHPSNINELCVKHLYLLMEGSIKTKKGAERVSIRVSMCENLGIRAYSSQARNCDLCEHDLWLYNSSHVVCIV